MSTVLVVDDDDGRALAAVVLRRAGLRVIEARSAHEALRLVPHRADLVLLDLHLPDIDGFEICRRLKADIATRDIPVLATTAVYFGAEERHEALAAGADGLITKPLEASRLVRTIRNLVRETHRRAV